MKKIQDGPFHTVHSQDVGVNLLHGACKPRGRVCRARTACWTARGGRGRRLLSATGEGCARAPHERRTIPCDKCLSLRLRGPSVDFSRAKCLMNADVALILERKREIMEAKGQAPKSDFIKAYKYVNQVKQFREKHVVVQVRKCVAQTPRSHATQDLPCPPSVDQRIAACATARMPGSSRHLASSLLRSLSSAICVRRRRRRRKR